jgi:hypothetical protein
VALLSGARNQNNSHLSQQIFDRMKKLFPGSRNSLTSASILLGNIYASSDELEKASDIQIQLQTSGAKKIAGVTRLVLKGEVFVSLQFLDSSLRKVSKDFILFFFVDRATKLIAAIRQCEIIVRDDNRIHHFHKNGRCSCNDYF